MPSTTRGSILISTANDIGEALVEKLGGVGYSPNEWKDKINLCGIAPVDSAPALSVLSDSAGTGDERGSILIATADAIGAILNKKYNVLRGFKPKEWASACRKMKALEEGSVASASIASFSDGADDVPTKTLVVTIPPTLSGVSSVTETQTGRNLFNVADYSQIYTDRDGVDSYNYRYMIIQLKPNTTYTVSQNSGAYSGTPIILINNALPVGGTGYFDLRKANDTKTYTTDSTGQLYIGSVNSYDDVAYTRLQECKVQIEYGSTAHDYEPYTTPTTYTASLGRTIYGGTADIVNGTGTEEYANTSLTDKNYYYYSSSLQRFDCALDGVISSGYMDDFIPPQGYTINHALIADGANAPDYTMCIFGGKLYIKNLSCSNVSDLVSDMSGKYITYSLATPTDFTFTGQEVPTRLGYNAFWSDSGNTAVEYYKAPTPYARKTATGGIANFSDQRTDLPLTKAIANIAPSIAGKSAVNLTRAGKNFYDIDEAEYNGEFYDASGNVVQYADCAVSWIKVNPSTKYSFSCTKETSQSVNVRVAWCKSDKSFISRQGLFSDNQFPMTLTTPSNCEWLQLSVNQYGAPSIAQNNWSIQVEQSEASTTFEPYNGTTYTAELGETVYGGSVDFVSGAKSVSFARVDMGSLTWQYDSANTRFFTVDLTSVIKRGSSGWLTDLAVDPTYTVASGTANDKTISEYATTGYIYIKDTDYTDPIAFKASLSGKYLTYPLATPTESAIPGIVISPIEGVNNYWNDAGGDTEIQYFENEA